MIFARLLVFTFLLIFSAPVLAAETEDQIGTILEAEGSASIKKDGKTRSALVNAPVYLGDQIVTHQGAKAFIQFIDGTEFTVSENATVTIDEYVYDPDETASNKSRYSVLRGAFLYTSGLVAKTDKPDVQVTTPYGAIGIRGTQFWGGLLDDEYGILVTDGEVDVKNDAGQVTVGKGLGTFLKDKKSQPGEVRAWKQAKIDRAVATITLKNPNLVARRVAARKALNEELIAKRREMRRENRKERIQKLRQNP